MGGVDTLRANAAAAMTARDARAAATPDWYSQFQEFRRSEWAPTVLPPEKESAFRKWLTNTDWFAEVKKDIADENGVDVKKIDDARALEMVLENSDYDYRGAWLDRASTSRDAHDGKIHWPSSDSRGRSLKSPEHPTAWKEFFQKNLLTNPDDLGLRDPETARQWSQRFRSR
jgi:hypothetical protein